MNLSWVVLFSPINSFLMRCEFLRVDNYYPYLNLIYLCVLCADPCMCKLHHHLLLLLLLLLPLRTTTTTTQATHCQLLPPPHGPPATCYLHLWVYLDISPWILSTQIYQILTNNTMIHGYTNLTQQQTKSIILLKGTKPTPGNINWCQIDDQYLTPNKKITLHLYTTNLID